MKSTTNRFSALNRRAEYLKLKSEKEKEKKEEENEEEELEEEEDDELDDKNKQNIQKPKNIPISKTPITPKTSFSRLNDKQKITTSTTSQIPYNFAKARMNYTQSNTNIDSTTKNPKDVLISRHGLQEKKFQMTGTPSAKNIINKTGQNSSNIIKPSQNSPKGIKSNSILQNNPSSILRATNSQSNLNSQKIGISGNKYSSLRRFGESFTKHDENKNEIKIINKNNNYTINVTNNNNTITVNNNNIANENNDITDINEKKKEKEKENEFDLALEEIKKEENKEYKYKSFSKKEPRRDYKTQNFTYNNPIEKNKINENINKKEEEKEKKIDNEIEKEEEIEEEMNLTNKVKEKEKDSNKKERKEYVSNEQMIENGIEIVKFTEEETNKVLEQKAENKEKKKNKKEKYEKKEKYINKTKYNEKNNKRETFTFHKRGANNFVKRSQYHHRNNKNENIYDEYDNVGFNNRRNYNDNRYNTFYDRGRPNPIYRGSRGRRGRFRY